jgi:hypothetical protein
LRLFGVRARSSALEIALIEKFADIVKLLQAAGAKVPEPPAAGDAGQRGRIVEAHQEMASIHSTRTSNAWWDGIPVQ